MKVLLLKDVYNLGRAGEVKRVADGFARNFLIPQKLAVLATAGALTHVERIKAAAEKQRTLLNEEMSGLAEQIAALELIFKAKVGETGKLFGSITQQMITDMINEKLHSSVDRHQVESQPLREIGEHMVRVRLTFDLIPQVKVIVESEEEEEKKEEAPRKRKSSRKAEKKSTEAAEEEASEEKTSEEVTPDEETSKEETPKQESQPEEKSAPEETAGEA
jgi:large subunit ribosomal protein L9